MEIWLINISYINPIILTIIAILTIFPSISPWFSQSNPSIPWIPVQITGAAPSRHRSPHRSPGRPPGRRQMPRRRRRRRRLWRWGARRPGLDEWCFFMEKWRKPMGLWFFCSFSMFFGWFEDNFYFFWWYQSDSWFQAFFIFHNIWDNPSHWLIFWFYGKSLKVDTRPLSPRMNEVKAGHRAGGCYAPKKLDDEWLECHRAIFVCWFCCVFGVWFCLMCFHRWVIPSKFHSKSHRIHVCYILTPSIYPKC
jgi:hypothetical protein